MEIGMIAVLLGLGIPMVAIICKTVISLAEMRPQNAPPPEPRELTGEEALFGISAAEDLRELKQRMDRLEGQIATIANAVQGGARTAPARSLDPIESVPPQEPPIVEQRS
jgi:hypothetical protein